MTRRGRWVVLGTVTSMLWVLASLGAAPTALAEEPAAEWIECAGRDGPSFGIDNCVRFSREMTREIANSPANQVGQLISIACSAGASTVPGAACQIAITIGTKAITDTAVEARNRGLCLSLLPGGVTPLPETVAPTGAIVTSCSAIPARDIRLGLPG